MLSGACSEGETGGSYGPFRKALEGYIRAAEVSQLDEDLGPYAGVLARLLPSVVERLPRVEEAG